MGFSCHNLAPQGYKGIVAIICPFKLHCIAAFQLRMLLLAAVYSNLHTLGVDIVAVLHRQNEQEEINYHTLDLQLHAIQQLALAS